MMKAQIDTNACTAVEDTEVVRSLETIVKLPDDFSDAAEQVLEQATFAPPETEPDPSSYSAISTWIGHQVEDIKYAIRSKYPDSPQVRNKERLPLFPVLIKKFKELKFDVRNILMDLGVVNSDARKFYIEQQKMALLSCKVVEKKQLPPMHALAWLYNFQLHDELTFRSDPCRDGEEFELRLKYIPAEIYDTRKSFEVTCHLHDAQLEEVMGMSTMREVYKITVTRLSLDSMRTRHIPGPDLSTGLTYDQKMNRLLRRLKITASSNMYGTNTQSFDNFVRGVHDNPELTDKEKTTLDDALTPLFGLSRHVTEMYFKRMKKNGKKDRETMNEQAKLYTSHAKAMVRLLKL